MSAGHTPDYCPGYCAHGEEHSGACTEPKPVTAILNQPWEDVADDVAGAIEKAVQPLLKTAVDSIYAGLLDTTQDYLRDNLAFNIASRINAAERDAADSRRALERVCRERDDLIGALTGLADVFALEGETSVDRFERLASMFRNDTGYLAPGKDQPMGGPDQPDGNELRAIYDAWYLAKVTRARAALAKARGETTNQGDS